MQVQQLEHSIVEALSNLDLDNHTTLEEFARTFDGYKVELPKDPPFIVEQLEFVEEEAQSVLNEPVFCLGTPLVWYEVYLTIVYF